MTLTLTLTSVKGTQSSFLDKIRTATGPRPYKRSCPAAAARSTRSWLCEVLALRGPASRGQCWAVLGQCCRPPPTPLSTSSCPRQPRPATPRHAQPRPARGRVPDRSRTVTAEFSLFGCSVVRLTRQVTRLLSAAVKCNDFRSFNATRVMTNGSTVPDPN